MRNLRCELLSCFFVFCNYYPTIIWILYAIFLKHKTLLPNRLLSTGTLILLSCIPKSRQGGHHSLLVPPRTHQQLIQNSHQDSNCRNFKNYIYTHNLILSYKTITKNAKPIKKPIFKYSVLYFFSKSIA